MATLVSAQKILTCIWLTPGILVGEVSDSVDLGRDPRFCLSNQLLRDAQSVGLRTEVESSASLYNGAESNLGARVLYEVEKTSLFFSQARGPSRLMPSKSSVLAWGEIVRSFSNGLKTTWSTWTFFWWVVCGSQHHQHSGPAGLRFTCLWAAQHC